MSGRKNGIARHPSPCYIGRASVGHCSKPVNNPAGDRTVSCYLIGYRSYSFRCPADLRPVVATTSAEKNSHFKTDSVRSPASVLSVAWRCPDGVRSRHRALLPMRRARWHHKNPPSSTDAGHRPGYVTGPLAPKLKFHRVATDAVLSNTRHKCPAGVRPCSVKIASLAHRNLIGRAMWLGHYRRNVYSCFSGSSFIV